MDIEKYETQDADNHLRYTFISKGKTEIMKIIAYNRLDYNLLSPQKRILSVYNLGFGDRMGHSLEIDDTANSNNGDMYKVFNTVLHTIPTFFSKHPDSCIAVKGSDKRRIRVYCNYVSRHYETLSSEYVFYGGTGTILTPFKVRERPMIVLSFYQNRRKLD